jgi:hypothetical protein
MTTGSGRAHLYLPRRKRRVRSIDLVLALSIALFLLIDKRLVPLPFFLLLLLP